MELVIRRGRPEDTESFITLLQVVWQGMENKEWFCLDKPDEVRDMLHAGIMELWVAVDGSRIAGAFDILIPGLNEYNYGYDLGLSEADLMRVINMDTAAVHPDYRGLGLQRKLMQTAERELRERGHYILMCTVHPDNEFSLNNVLKQGYTIQHRLPKYGSERYVLRKDLL